VPDIVVLRRNSQIRNALGAPWFRARVHLGAHESVFAPQQITPYDAVAWRA